MAVSPISSSELTIDANAVFEAVLHLLWRQWTALGVSGAAVVREIESPPMLDPEALIVATLRLGRRDPRLFDEMLDWCAQNGEWLSLNRLKTLASTAAMDDKLLLPTLSAAAAVLDAKDSRGRWRSLSALATPSQAAPIPFFQGMDGATLPVYGPLDPAFARFGLACSEVELRGLSRPIPMADPACLLLRLRTLIGIGPRSEITAYLLTNGRDAAAPGAREIARAVACSPPAAYEALAALSAGGFLIETGARPKSINTARWRRFLGGDHRNAGAGAPLPRWVDWTALYLALVLIVEEALPAMSPDAAPSPYLRASRLNRLHDLLRFLLASGRIVPGDHDFEHAGFVSAAALGSAEADMAEGIRWLVSAISQL